jgi:predicted aspartyl protease
VKTAVHVLIIEVQGQKAVLDRQVKTEVHVLIIEVQGQKAVRDQ